MQGARYWILQYVLAAASMFGLLVVVDLIGGKQLGDGIWLSLIFALAASAIFIGARYLRSRKG
jgi:hypothetical protein